MQNKFNANYKNYFLTYAQCRITKWAMACHLNSIFSEYGIDRWAIGREKHADGNWHLHAVYSLVTKCHTRDPRKFDAGSRHPNIKAANQPDSVFGYCTKYDTKWIGNWNTHPCTATDYRKKKADLDAYQLEKEFQELVSPFPFELPNEVLVPVIPEDKKRHWWFISKPDWGKTSWINDTFAGKQVYLCPADTKYRWEGYRGEEVIIYDDCWPTRSDITDAGTIWSIRKQVPGDTRYTRVYWPLKKSRLIIVLHNNLPEYQEETWFLARFNCYDLNKMSYI